MTAKEKRNSIKKPARIAGVVLAEKCHPFETSSSKDCRGVGAQLRVPNRCLRSTSTWLSKNGEDSLRTKLSRILCFASVR
jgi:hypothetical protein